MKYIRTKDNVWQYDRNRNVVRPSEDGKSIVYWLHFVEKEIVKQADTIEELCDEIVFYDLEEEVMQILSPSFSKWSILNDLKDGRIKDNNVYGAIWTEWGLKYVAKMNEEGNLELL